MLAPRMWCQNKKSDREFGVEAVALHWAEAKLELILSFFAYYLVIYPVYVLPDICQSAHT